MAMSKGATPASTPGNRAATWRDSQPMAKAAVRGPDARSTLRRVERLTKILDQNWTIPGTRFRFGLDPLIGLIPGVGDAVSMGLSIYPIVEAWRLGVPRRLLGRMVANIVLDGIIGVIPVAGDAFDFVFQANRRNLRLLKRHVNKHLAGANSLARRVGE
ncbi:MAG: DUF4112 domain-containing protein [Phycisphaerae bacterium]